MCLFIIIALVIFKSFGNHINTRVDSFIDLITLFSHHKYDAIIAYFFLLQYNFELCQIYNKP
jgi:hypothetical protein